MYFNVSKWKKWVLIVLFKSLEFFCFSLVRFSLFVVLVNINDGDNYFECLKIRFYIFYVMFLWMMRIVVVFVCFFLVNFIKWDIILV